MSQLTDFFNRVNPEFITSEFPTVLIVSGTYSFGDLHYVLNYANQSANLKHILLISNDYEIAQAVKTLSSQYPQLCLSYCEQQNSLMAQAQLLAQNLGSQAELSAELITICEYLLQTAVLDEQLSSLLVKKTVTSQELALIFNYALAHLSLDQHQQFMELAGSDYLYELQQGLKITLDLLAVSSQSRTAQTVTSPENKVVEPQFLLNHLCFYPKTKDELLEILEQWQLVSLGAGQGATTYQANAWLQAVATLTGSRIAELAIGLTFWVGTNDSGIKTLGKFTAPAAMQLYNSNRVRFFSSEGAYFVLTAQALQKSKSSFYNLGSELRNLELKKTQATQFPALVTSQRPFDLNTPVVNLLESIDQIKIYSSKGIFSPEHLDTGTQVLLKTYLDLELPANQQFVESVLKNTYPAAILDYGCGSGVISKFLDLYLQEFVSQALQYEKSKHTQVWQWKLFDVSRAALNSAQYNLSESKGRISFLWGTSLKNFLELHGHTMECVKSQAEVGTCKYQHIIANPPFHTGNQQTFSIVENLIAHAAQQLFPHGTLRMVANEGLPYLSMLRKHFKQITELAREAGFVVYLASK